MVFRFRAIAILIAGSALFSTVRAQEPTTTVVIPPMNCTKPDEPPRIEPSSAQMKTFQRGVDEYKNCVITYAKGMQDKAKDLAAQYGAYADAANKTIEDFNAYITDLNAKNAAKK